MMMPYFHGVYRPPTVGSSTKHRSTPWSMPWNRSTLLTFVGGTSRGHNRSINIARFRELSKTWDGHYPAGMKRLFSTPYLLGTIASEKNFWGFNDMYAKGYEAYAGAVFSFQPLGDSYTRRAFYDSWMLGAIPVISRKSAMQYKGLFLGLAFDCYREFSIEKVVVVLPDKVMDGDPDGVMRRLLAISAREVAERQRKLRILAPFMQWGWQGQDWDGDGWAMSLLPFHKIHWIPKLDVPLCDKPGPWQGRSPILFHNRTIVHFPRIKDGQTSSGFIFIFIAFIVMLCVLILCFWLNSNDGIPNIHVS